MKLKEKQFDTILDIQEDFRPSPFQPSQKNTLAEFF